MVSIPTLESKMTCKEFVYQMEHLPKSFFSHESNGQKILIRMVKNRNLKILKHLFSLFNKNLRKKLLDDNEVLYWWAIAYYDLVFLPSRNVTRKDKKFLGNIFKELLKEDYLTGTIGYYYCDWINERYIDIPIIYKDCLKFLQHELHLKLKLQRLALKTKMIKL